MAARLDLTLVNNALQFGVAGQKIKSDSGKLQSRNAADNAFVNHQGLDAVANEDFVTLSQMNALINGLAWLPPARVRVDANVVIAAPGASLDGIAMVAGESFLLTLQTVPSEEGWWIWNGAAVPATRPDYYASGDTKNSAASFVSEGTSADSAYVVTTDPNVVDTSDPDIVQFTSVVTGITLIALAGGATGVSIIDSGTGPTATLRGILGESSVLTATISGDDVVVSVDALGITTAKLDNGAVTEAKISNGSGVMIARRLAFGFADAPTVSVGAVVPSGSTVLNAFINVTSGWSAGATLQLGTSGSPGLLVDTAENDPSTVDIYETANDELLGIDTQFIVTIGGAPGAGAGVALLRFTI